MGHAAHLCTEAGSRPSGPRGTCSRWGQLLRGLAPLLGRVAPQPMQLGHRQEGRLQRLGRQQLLLAGPLLPLALQLPLPFPFLLPLAFQLFLPLALLFPLSLALLLPLAVCFPLPLAP